MQNATNKIASEMIGKIHAKAKEQKEVSVKISAGTQKTLERFDVGGRKETLALLVQLGAAALEEQMKLEPASSESKPTDGKKQ